MRNEKKLNQWKLKIKKYGLKMISSKLATVRILRKLHINVRREVKDTTVKKGDHFTYFGREIEEDSLTHFLLGAESFLRS